MNQDGRDFGLPARFSKKSDGFIGQRLCFPAARIAREKLHGIAAGFFCDDKGFVEPAFDGSMKTDPWFLSLALFGHNSFRGGLLPARSREIGGR